MSQTEDTPIPSAWTWADPVYAGVPGIDPDVEWALGAGRDFFFLPGRQDRWMPVLVQLRGVSARDFASGERFFDVARSLTWWQESVRVSPLYIEADEDDRRSPQFVAMVREGFFAFLKNNEELQKAVIRVTLGLPLDAESLSFSSATGGRDRP